MPDSPAKDKNYNLVTVVQQSLANTWQLEEYIQDADREGDGELSDWLRRVQQNNQQASDQGKQMLVQRLQAEGG
jgi:hypothetical protein